MRLTRVAVIIAFFLALTPGLAAAGEYCASLSAELKTVSKSGGSAKDKRYAQAAEKQRRALVATEGQAREAGCKSVFRRSQAGCALLNSTITKMKTNLKLLESMGGGSRRTPAKIRAQMVENGCDLPKAPKKKKAENDGGFANIPAGSYRTLCVRMCDGYYFPISWSVERTGFAKDALLCKMRCPGAEAGLFIHPTGTESETAMSLKGETYAGLPNAFKYRDALDPGCGCGSASASFGPALPPGLAEVPGISQSVADIPGDATLRSTVEP